MFKSTFLVCRRLPTINVCGEHSIQTETNSIVKQVQGVKIPVPWGHVAGKWWGRTDCQPLLGLHGWEDNSGTFDNLAPLLKVDGFLAIDFPGHGLSSHYPIGRPYFFMDSVLLLRYITKYFKWDKISVMGHSYGSATAFTYSAFFPNNVTNYISIDCARTLMSPDKNTELLHLRHVCDSLMSLEEKLEKCTPPSYTYDTIVELLHKGSFESPSKESCKILLQRGITKSAGTEDRYYFSRDPRLKLHSMMRFQDEFILKFAELVTCNYLSIVANEGLLFDDRKEVYMKTVEHMKKSNYKVEHYEVEGTHHVHINNAERVAPFVNCFLSG